MTTQKTKELLLEAYEYCRELDKSTEYTLQYMKDFSGADLDTVIIFIQNMPIVI